MTMDDLDKKILLTTLLRELGLEPIYNKIGRENANNPALVHGHIR